MHVQAGRGAPVLPDQFSEQGYVLLPALLQAGECDALGLQLEDGVAAAPSRAGTRCLLSQPWCRALAARLQRHAALAGLLPAGGRAVQCTSFRKSTTRNWAVPLHQDLSIPVAARVHDPWLRGWSEKEGGLYVQPPADLLQQLVALRLHVDDCRAEDGPLRVVPGSHRLGVLDDAALLQAAAHARHVGAEAVCAAPRGSALVMRPLLLHGSSRATGTSARRVLHFVYGPRELPCGLSWPAAHPGRMEDRR
jgi:hypothetical protein